MLALTRKIDIKNRLGRSATLVSAAAHDRQLLTFRTTQDRDPIKLARIVKALTALLLLMGLLFGQMSVASAQVADPFAVDDESLTNPSGPVVVSVLLNDEAFTDLDPATLRIVDPQTFEADLLSYVEPGQGVWRVDDAAGTITFTPCMAPGDPDTSCVGAFVEPPYPIEYQVQDSTGALSNPAFVMVDFQTTLPVTLAYFTSGLQGDRVWFQWTTATELSNAGFNLLAQHDDQLIQLNGDLLPSQSIDSAVPLTYRYIDARGTAQAADAYYLQEVSLDGVTVNYGPFLLGAEYGTPITDDPIGWQLPGEDTQHQIFLPALINSSVR